MNVEYYFDYNATHPPFRDVLQEHLKTYLDNFYNPSGITKYSLTRQAILEEVREYFAKLTKKKSDHIIFCSTGTESNYMLVQSLASQVPKPIKIITSPYEHPSMYGAFEFFGFSTDLLSANLSGKIDLTELEDKLKESPAPVIIVTATNEAGIIQPVNEISALAQKFGVPFYSDLMQAFGKIEIDFNCFDGFSFSGHKIGAGMGASLVYIDPKYTNGNHRIFIGGNQENEHRAGTENSFAIQCLKSASEIQLASLSTKNQRLTEFQLLIESKLKNIGSTIVGEFSQRIPNTSLAILPLDTIDFLMLGLEDKGYIISTGSSCKSRTREASRSLLSMGFSEEEALRAIRISTGIFTEKKFIDSLLETILDLIYRLQ